MGFVRQPRCVTAAYLDSLGCLRRSSSCTVRTGWTGLSSARSRRPGPATLSASSTPARWSTRWPPRSSALAQGAISASRSCAGTQEGESCSRREAVCMLLRAFFNACGDCVRNKYQQRNPLLAGAGVGARGVCGLSSCSSDFRCEV